jgi:microcystin-dependent protein
MAAHTHGLAVGVGPAAQSSAASAQSNLGFLAGYSGTNQYGYYWTAPPSPLVAMDPGIVAHAGAATPAAHENRQPCLALNFCICLEGEYPINPN